MNAIDKMVEFYNTNDFSGLKNVLAKNCIYRSQWVFDEISGRDNICEYLTDKSKAIAKSGCFPNAKKTFIVHPYRQEAIAISQGSSEIKALRLQTRGSEHNAEKRCKYETNSNDTRS